MPIAPIQNYRPPFDRPGLAGAEFLQLAGPTLMGPNASLSKLMPAEQLKAQAKLLTKGGGDEFISQVFPHLVRNLELVGKAGIRLKDPQLVSETTNRLHQLLSIFPEVRQNYTPEIQSLLNLLGR